jgi:hypothetical protein
VTRAAEAIVSFGLLWKLGSQGSNLGWVVQSDLCYRYTTPHCAAWRYVGHVI